MYGKRMFACSIVFALLIALTTVSVSAMTVTSVNSGSIALDSLASDHVNVSADVRLDVRDPETFDSFAAAMEGSTVLIFPGMFQVAGYSYEVAASAELVADDGRPVALLTADGVADPEVHFPRNETQRFVDSGEIAFSDLAAVRYAVEGYDLYVMTIQPSPAAAEHPILLGGKTVVLDDGSKAYATMTVPSATPHQVISYKDGLLIALVSDMPVDMMVELSNELEIN